ncbi:MAG: hypothetical protein J6X55_07385 [Victivallales bacterium]|nr:hypothetical protein [Victivallales bacterium]
MLPKSESDHLPGTLRWTGRSVLLPEERIVASCLRVYGIGRQTNMHFRRYTLT